MEYDTKDGGREQSPFKKEDIPKYIALQEERRKEVLIQPLKGEIKTIAGADVSMNLYSDTLYAGVIVLSYPELQVLETTTVEAKTDFPYIPGLLSFREMPALLACIRKLSIMPSVLMVDGQGIAHPRRLGIAAHLGVVTGIPAIGCAKSVLYGKEEGGRLIDPKSCEVIGMALQSKERCKPLIISPGHLITLEESVDIVRSTLRGYRLPEPTRRAHLLVNDFRKGIIKNQIPWQ